MGKSSISMGHLYHGYVSHNQRVTSIELVEIQYFGVIISQPSEKNTVYIFGHAASAPDKVIQIL